MTKRLFLFCLPFFFLHLGFSQTWIQKANIGGSGRVGAVSFSIGSKAYVGMGNGTKDFWEWEQSTNTWSQKADFAGTARSYAVGFSIGAKGYVGTGYDASFNYRNDFWEWDQANNQWTVKPSFPGAIRENAIGFSIGTRGYIGTGYDGTPPISEFNDFWEWNPSSNAWTQKANVPGGIRGNAVGFSIGTKGYVGLGTSGIFTVSVYNDFWEWDQLTNSWIQKATFPGKQRSGAIGFSVAGKGFIGTGTDSSGNYESSFWEWDQTSDLWTKRMDFSGGGRIWAAAFVIGNCGYIGTGFDSTSSLQDFWECCSLLGVNNYERENDILIFPTVSSGQFNIEIKNPVIKIKNIEVYNVEGGKVFHSPYFKTVIDISNMESGMYFLHLATDKGGVSKKILVKR